MAWRIQLESRMSTVESVMGTTFYPHPDSMPINLSPSSYHPHTSTPIPITAQVILSLSFASPHCPCYRFIHIIIIIIIRHAPCQCVAPLATNSLHSDLSRASSIASSKVRLCRDRSLFKAAIQEV